MHLIRCSKAASSDQGGDFGTRRKYVHVGSYRASMRSTVPKSPPCPLEAPFSAKSATTMLRSALQNSAATLVPAPSPRQLFVWCLFIALKVVRYMLGGPRRTVGDMDVAYEPPWMGSRRVRSGPASMCRTATPHRTNRQTKKGKSCALSLLWSCMCSQRSAPRHGQGGLRPVRPSLAPQSLQKPACRAPPGPRGRDDQDRYRLFSGH